MVSNISSNSIAYFLSILGIFVIVAIGVNAYGTTNPAVFGHTLDDELAPPAGCLVGQALQWTTSGWKCADAGIINGTNNYIPWLKTSNSITNSVIYENAGNIGIGRTNPRSKLDVQGDIRATGSICDGTGKCVGGDGAGQWIVSDEYILRGNGGSDWKFMDEHFFCFLVEVTMANDAGDYYCKIEYGSETYTTTGWILRINPGASTSNDICKARCIN